MNKKIKILALKKLLKESEEGNIQLRAGTGYGAGHPISKGNPKQVYGKSQTEYAEDEEELENGDEVEEESEDIEVSKAFKQE
jgi:hypothetical protein|tara:strand:- start:881 stop:1126 length:246 start_codon:yes stop_codon:yes gene_type:complete